MAVKKKKKSDKSANSNAGLPGCSCITDPFAELPPEVRPPAKPAMGNLRQVICPGCGLEYWTNRSTDLCRDCQQKNINITQKTGG